MAREYAPVNPITTRYRYTKINGKKVAIHRAIMEKHIGRKLLTTEYVHHKNDIKTDNSIGNLEIKNPVAHGRDHHLKYPISKFCVICGTKFTPHKTKRKRQKTCGNRECYLRTISISEHNTKTGEGKVSA